jgi:O-antigen ligase
MNIPDSCSSRSGSASICKRIDQVILFCLYVLVFFLPIAHTETIRALAVAIPFVLWIVKMILERRWLWIRTPIDIPILLFTLVAALSLVTAVDFLYSWDEFTGEWLMGVLLFYVVANSFRGQHIKVLWVVILCGNIVMVSYGIYEFFLRGGALFDYQVRAQSLHYGFGAFSTYLVTVLPYLLVGFLLVGKGRPVRWVFGVISLGNLFVLYLTQSRGAWVAAILCLIWTGSMYLPKKKMILLGALGLLLFLIFLSKGVMQHHAPIIRPDLPATRIETSQARWHLILFSLDKIKENPLQMLGFGQRSFVKKYPEFYNQYKGALLWQAHNTFLNVTFQTGVQGLALFIFLLYALLKYNYNMGREESFPWRKFYFQSTFMMIIIFFVRNSTDDFFKDDSALLFWFFSGVAVSLRKG